MCEHVVYQGVQLILAYSCAGLAILVAGKDRGECFYYALERKGIKCYPVRPIRTSVPICVWAITPKPYGIYL